ncbi:Tumor necrosis factor receptor superfamily member 14 [Oryzias melastigma]|uniref:Tumor necrosis factor receptor superfamily member 14 n=1 Tax=Oryzias melastigma TaxID=30732 RepID=A0A834C642_ORYME|nr:Tumor necrosis factor receptor superfamily member 14 [Oryzias melastigma]
MRSAVDVVQCVHLEVEFRETAQSSQLLPVCRVIEGTYNEKYNGVRNCAHCSLCHPGSGLKVKLECTLTSDSVCEPQDGFFCLDWSSKSCGAAQKHSSCKGGQYISQRGTASTDTECSDCSTGTFSDGTGTSCQPHTQ